MEVARVQNCGQPGRWRNMLRSSFISNRKVLSLGLVSCRKSLWWSGDREAVTERKAEVAEVAGVAGACSRPGQRQLSVPSLPATRLLTATRATWSRDCGAEPRCSPSV